MLFYFILFYFLFIYFIYFILFSFLSGEQLHARLSFCGRASEHHQCLKHAQRDCRRCDIATRACI